MLVLAYEALRSTGRSAWVRSADHPLPWASRAAAEAPEAAYALEVARLRETVSRLLAPGSRLVVISKGDDDLLVPGFDALHFPQSLSGGYAGYHPADSAAAVAHLEQCRAAGAAFLVVPGSAFWWFDYYDGLARHLLVTGRVVHHDRHCLIFDLRPDSEGAASL